MKVGQPDGGADLQKVRFLRKELGDSVPIMVEANQQWDRVSALRFGRRTEDLRLVWIEEPLNACDAEGHAALADALDTPIATGEMLSSVAEHAALIENRAVDVTYDHGPRMAPHFVMK